jgi:hypothetical protein
MRILHSCISVQLPGTAIAPVAFHEAADRSVARPPVRRGDIGSGSGPARPSASGAHRHDRQRVVREPAPRRGLVLFRNIRAPQGQLAGPAILMWNGTSGSVVESNTFINCQREIALGLIERTPDDHTGGIVRNNFIYRDPTVAGDAAIGVFDSPNTLVLHNTILGSGTYGSLIEYRFPHAMNVRIANNLLDGSVLARNGATGAVTGNVTNASASMFVNAAAGDLRLKPSATTAIDRVPPSADVPFDWEGESRPQASAADVGADELTGTVPSVPQNLRFIP